jgi:hypothetical protein
MVVAERVQRAFRTTLEIARGALCRAPRSVVLAMKRVMRRMGHRPTSEIMVTTCHAIGC